VALPALRPLVWSGDPADPANIGYACLLAVAIAIGWLRRALGDRVVRCGWIGGLGSLVLVLAAVGAWRSPYPYDAWALWIAWVLHIAAALALADAARARPGLLVAGLLGGLVAEGATLAAQVRWERPALLARLALDPGVVEHEALREQYAARAASWRLEGTFLLANSLAAYLVLLAPLVAGLAWSTWRARRGRVAALVLAALTILAVLRTGSKMGMLALVAASAVAATVVARGWMRAALVTAAVAAVILALVLPASRERLAGSAAVRIGYWRAAVAMIGERPWTGHGLDGFKLHYPRRKAPGAEPTTIAHSEPVQAAVDLGLPAAVAFVVWMSAILAALWRARRPLELTLSPRQRVVPALLAGMVVAYALAAAGGFSGAGSASGPGMLVGAVLAALVVLTAAGMPLAPLPGWAIPAGVLACLLHACADFPLHSTQVVGPLALLVVLGGPPPIGPGVRLPARIWGGGALAILALACALGVIAQVHADRRERVVAAADVLRRTASDGMGGLQSALLDFGLPGDASIEDLAQALLAEVMTESRSFPTDPRLAEQAVFAVTAATAASPALAERLLPALRDFAQRWPLHLVFLTGCAELERTIARSAADPLERERAARAAIEWSHRAVALAPTHLPLRRQLARQLRASGDRVGAAHQEAEVGRLEPLVHPADR
jgi:hypothetical protein